MTSARRCFSVSRPQPLCEPSHSTTPDARALRFCGTDCHADGKSFLGGKGRWPNNVPKRRGEVTGCEFFGDLRNVRVDNATVFGCSYFSPKAVKIDVRPDCSIANFGGGEQFKGSNINNDGSTTLHERKPRMPCTEHLMPVEDPETIVRILRDPKEAHRAAGSNARYAGGMSGGSAGSAALRLVSIAADRHV